MSAEASLGMVPTPAIEYTLPALVRMRMGASPPMPKCESSVTEAAKMVATPASTALPPASYMRMPASVAHSLPPATAPCVPRTGWRIGGSGRRFCASQVIITSVDAISRVLRSIEVLSLNYNGFAVKPDSATGIPDSASVASESEPMLYCPVCSLRLTERKCKLCERCGYYMSCADYY